MTRATPQTAAAVADARRSRVVEHGHRAFPWLSSLLLAWGVFSFGGVYAWGSIPLLAGVAVSAIWMWRPARPWGAPVWALALVAAAVGIQLVPLEIGTLERVSPGAHRILTELDVAYALGVHGSHSLSIDPSRTLRALMFLAANALWVAVCAGVLASTPSHPRTLARNIAAIGTLVAVTGLAQQATFNGKLLWFWTPNFYTWNSFGPFVNRNHFAGWMLLALALSIGLLLGLAARVRFSSRATWRDRVLWLGSHASAPVLLTAGAALTMACALVWTMSRSGMASAAIAVLILMIAALRRARGLRRGIVAALVLAAFVGVVSWRGAGTLAQWYGNTGTLQWRVQLWKDSLPALDAFWVTGSGLNTYGTLMLVQPRTNLSSQPREAHNDYLQLAIEGGVLVGLPALLLMWALGLAIVRRLREAQDELTWWIRMGAVAAICGMAVQELVEFSLHIPGVALLFATAVGIAIHRPAGQAAPRPARRADVSDARAEAA